MSGRFAIIYLDALVQECGYFNPSAKVNNGYGCVHPKQTDIENGEGRCFTFSCPIATQIDPSSNDLQQAREDFELLREHGWSIDEIDDVTEASSLMHVHDEKWLAARRTR